MVYWCDHCDCAVENPRWERRIEIHTEVDTRCEEEMELPICPKCGEELAEEAEKCMGCGDYVPARETLCDFCRDVVEFEYRRMIKTVADRIDRSLNIAEDCFDEWEATRKEIAW